jgi:hypothetical protein
MKNFEGGMTEREILAECPTLNWRIFASACVSPQRQPWSGNFRFQLEISDR